MEIIRLSNDEPVRLRSIRLRALEDAPDAFDSTWEDAVRRSEADWRRQLSSLATFVAVKDGVDIGMVRGAPDPDDEAAAWLLSMWIDPRHRGRGAGDALVTAVVEWARSEGFQRVMLDVGDHNLPAIDLYARHGFEATGEVGCLSPPRSHITEHRRVRNLAS